MPIEFDVRHDAPLGSAPTEMGTAQNAFERAREATAGFALEVERINADARFSPAGKQAQIWKLREDRESLIAAANHLIEAEKKDVAELETALRRESEIDAPVTPDRVALIVAAYQELDKSAQLSVVRGADAETARSLLAAPRILNLLSDSSREVLEDRLLGSVGDGSRLQALKARMVGLGQATYATDTATAWLDKRAGIATDVRTRIARSRS